jgi:hypothetical protein
METSDQNLFRGAMILEKIDEAQKICEDLRGSCPSALMGDLALATFLIRLEKSLLQNEAGQEGGVTYTEIMKSLSGKIKEEVEKIISTDDEAQANHARVKALRYSQAELLLSMLDEGVWTAEEWHAKARLLHDSITQIRREDDDPLAVSWDGDADYEDKEGKGSGRFPRQLLEV